MLLGYARVSTAEQNADLQTDELTSAGCYAVFVDHASRVLDRRPELEKVLERLRPGDTLVVWRLDPPRPLPAPPDRHRHLSGRAGGRVPVAGRESIDTTTAGGRLVFHLFGALAQFEREIIRDRTMAGLSAARARGRNGGRPAKLSPDQVRAGRRLYDERTPWSRSAASSGSAAPLYTGVARQATPGEPSGGRHHSGSGPSTLDVDSWAAEALVIRPGERLVTVLVTLAVPAEADAEDADAAVSTALEVVSTAGV